MTISDFKEKFTIKPDRDIFPNFTLVKTQEIDCSRYKGCLYCGNKIELNQQFLRSEPWTGVQASSCCDTLNVIYRSDRMGGTDKDEVRSYKEKEK